MARKITTEAVNAFMDGEEYKKDNTRVYIDHLGRTVMALHGNIIAHTLATDDDMAVFTDCGWCTRTTYERLGELIKAWTNGFFTASMRKGGTLIRLCDGYEIPMVGNTQLRRA